MTSSALSGAGRGTPRRDNMQIPAASTPPASGQSQAKLTVRTRMQKTPYWLKKVRRATAPCRHVWTLLCGEPKGKAHKDPAPGDEDVEDLYETWGMAMLVSRPLCFFCAQSISPRDNSVCVPAADRGRVPHDIHGYNPPSHDRPHLRRLIDDRRPPIDRASHDPLSRAASPAGRAAFDITHAPATARPSDRRSSTRTYAAGSLECAQA